MEVTNIMTPNLRIRQAGYSIRVNFTETTSGTPDLPTKSSRRPDMRVNRLWTEVVCDKEAPAIFKIAGIGQGVDRKVSFQFRNTEPGGICSAAEKACRYPFSYCSI